MESEDEYLILRCYVLYVVGLFLFRWSPKGGSTDKHSATGLTKSRRPIDMARTFIAARRSGSLIDRQTDSLTTGHSALVDHKRSNGGLLMRARIWLYR